MSASEVKVTVSFLSKDVEKSELDGLVRKAAESMGYVSVKDEQLGAVLAFLQGRDVFVSMPTGSGKSLCFVLIPCVVDLLRTYLGIPYNHRSMMIVVSPLISLMMDQVEK